MPVMKRSSCRWSRKTSPSHVCVSGLAVVLGLALAPSANAATACAAPLACGTTCTPAAPVAISTLVASGDFPAGANTPVAFVDPNDGTSHRLIATQEGAILVWDGRSQQILPTFFLDLRDDVGGPVVMSGERGLLSLALDPNYAANGRFYVYYTRANLGPGTLGDIVIERYTRSAANPDVADPASATTILVIEHSSAGNHNGGNMAFGPNDGFLYVTVGDGGNGCDDNQGINGDGQRSDSLLGKMLRLDVRGVDPAAGPPDDCSVTAGAYTVPSSNPFFGQEPACDEVWAMGLRNPFRFTFDRATGDIYIGDVGQGKWEEIDLLAAATAAPVNFGWSCREGCQASSTSGCSTTGCPMDTGTDLVCEFPRATGRWDPVLCHGNASSGWRSIMSGYRYRGHLVPSLAGDYIYGDAACGQIWKTDTLDPANPAAISSSCWASGYGGTYGFAEDHLGELYVVVGGAHRIDCIHNGDGCYWAGAEFLDGFESGDTGAWTDEVP